MNLWVDDSNSQRTPFLRTLSSTSSRHDNFRNENENMVSVEEIVSGDLAKKKVQEFRAKILAEITEEDLKPQVINDKIVYVSVFCHFDSRV